MLERRLSRHWWLLAGMGLLGLLGLTARATDPLERTGRLPPIDVVPLQQPPSPQVLTHRMPPPQAAVTAPAASALPLTSELPGAAAAPDLPGFLLASDPREFRTADEVLAPPAPHLQAHKQGFFQKLSFSATEVLPDGSGGLGLLETELVGAFALPAPTTDMPLILIPTLQVDFVDEPVEVALPGTLYGAFVEFMWLPRLGPRTLAMVAVVPGWYSDFQDGEDDAFRLTGRAIIRYDWQPERIQLVLGAVYVNRMHSRWVPAAGVILMPTPDWNFELIFPQTKLARRLSWGLGFEHWVYLAGGFGGNDWRIRQPDGSPDTLGLFDWRITAGWERKLNGGAGLLVEAGYVFSREIRFASAGLVHEPDDTVLLRAGFAY